MKKLHFWIAVSMLALLLCGCSSNNIPATSDNEIAAKSSDTTAENNDFSFSDGSTTSTPEVTTSEPTQSTQESTDATTVTSSEAPQKTNSQAGTTNSSTKSTSKPAESSQAPTKTPDNSTSSKPPAQTDPPKETPKSVFAKPYDIATMKSELIAYGNGVGMTHITNMPEDWGGDKITPDNSTWLPPVETWHYGSSSSDKLKQDLCSDIKGWKNKGESTYTLWFEKDNKHSGDYIIYVLIG